MKNKLPLVLAILIGLGAVFLVNRSITKNTAMKEDTVTVIIAGRKLAEGEILTASALAQKTVPVSAIPQKAIPWDQLKTIENQKTKRAVGIGDYILWSDLSTGMGIADIIGEDDWAVSVMFPDSAITRSLRSGDEIAIIATFTATVTHKSKLPGEPAKMEKKKTTVTLLPCVRIVSIGASGNEVVLALPPQQAQIVIAAQRNADLYPALRREHSTGNMNRNGIGQVDEATFSKLIDNVDSISMPEIPNEQGRK